MSNETRIGSVEIRDVMDKLKVTEGELAALLNIEPVELRAYLCGAQLPDGPVKILLFLLHRDPYQTAVKLGRQLIDDKGLLQ